MAAEAELEASEPALPEPLDEVAATGFVGVILAAQSLDIAPEADGRIANVRVVVGQTVSAGEVIAELDPAAIEEALKMAEAEYAAARATAAELSAKSRYSREYLATERALHREGIASSDSLKAARAETQQAGAATSGAVARIAEAQARVEQYTRMLKETELRAPFSGKVAVVYHAAGERVGPASPVARIIGDEKLLLRFAIDPREVSNVAIGGAVVIEVADAEPLRGVVTKLSPAVDIPTGLVFAEAELATATGHELRANSPVRVRLG